jgi:chorismate dehydratase
MKIRISLVHYLNSAPLGWAFLHGPFRDSFEVFPSSPAKCADQLSRGDADIGVIPSIEYQRIKNLQIIPDVSISSMGKVRSILLIRPISKPAVNYVALDESSRTSVALAKVLLHSKMGIRPKYVSCPPDLGLMLQRSDAALLIGDPALKVNLAEYAVMDLAEEWVEWQQKPFVCAFWACRKEASLPDDLNDIFLEAKNWGLKHREEIASVFAGSLHLPVSFLEGYLRHNIDYDLGATHIEGLNKFYQLARQENLIQDFCPLEFT